ncbi:sensor histidine kinase [Hyalangium gracile]|uniref:sensor histidine kinase n=1 Tax=Hyalangium gracile TaxID=394092 RepID=UPI001CC9B2D1|nr:hybrid sensor histidine kinase/response regulator [Hyalangium gracile]
MSGNASEKATPPWRVLIVDDDPASRSTVAAQLSPVGYHLRLVPSGEEALAAVREEPPDIVLLDVMMPGLTGLDVCRRLRERLREDYIPIILITALDERDDVLQGLGAGADDFLRKPVQSAELRARVSNLLKVREYYRLVASERDKALATVDALRQQVLQADRLATLGTFAAGVSHELNNIAQVLRAALELPSPDSPGAAEGEEMPTPEVLDHVLNHVTELARTILRMARPTEGLLPETDLRRTLEEVRNMLRITGRARHARLVVTVPEQACVIRASPVHAQQVFLNLLGNAADAVADMPQPVIEAGVRAAPGGQLEAWVQDNGPGMPEEVLGRIFEPFFTTKPPGAGTGLGLPVVKQLVESWGGRLHVHSQPGRGTRMVMEIPAASATHSVEARP